MQVLRGLPVRRQRRAEYRRKTYAVGASGRVAEACNDVDRRVEQLNAIVKKTCDAEAAKLPPQEDCPAKSWAMDDIIAALNDSPGCDRAMKIFEDCEYVASGDVQFGAVVEKKCEADFLCAPQGVRDAGLSAQDAGLRPQIRQPVRHHVPVVDSLLPGGGRPALLAESAEGRTARCRRAERQPHAASAALAFSAIAWNAAGSLMARSDSTLRSTVMPDFDRPLMKTL